MRLVKLACIGAICLTGCGRDGPWVREAIVFGESRRIAPGVLRLYVQGDLNPPDVERIDFRRVGRGVAEVQVRERVEGDGPAIAGIYCIDVTVPDDVARRRLREPDGERLVHWGGITSGETLEPGCARHEGNVVERFEPLEER